MKELASAGIIATLVSFILWLISWTFWTYQQFVPYDSATYEAQRTIRYVFQGIGAFSTLIEYLAIMLIAVAVLMAAKRLPRN